MARPRFDAVLQFGQGGPAGQRVEAGGGLQIDASSPISNFLGGHTGRILAGAVCPGKARTREMKMTIFLRWQFV